MNYVFVRVLWKQDLLYQKLGNNSPDVGIVWRQRHLGKCPCSGRRNLRGLATPYQGIKEAVLQADIVHVDEIGGEEKGTRHWPCVAVASMVALFLVSCSRGQKALKELSGEQFQGTALAIWHRSRPVKSLGLGGGGKCYRCQPGWAGFGARLPLAKTPKPRPGAAISCSSGRTC